MVNKTQFIKYDFNLPDHTIELQKATEVIDELKMKFKEIQKTKSIDGKKHTALYEETIKILFYIGKLSEPAFKIEDEIEILYTLEFMHAPELGRKLCNDHYEQIHYPYNLLKNRCFKLLEDLDEEYYKVWKKHPPNWNL
jgi:hypothetical protein